MSSVIRQFRKLYFILFLGSGFSVPLWDFVGTTMVTNNYVRLTPDYQSRQGGIWNTMVIKKCYMYFLFCKKKLKHYFLFNWTTITTIQICPPTFSEKKYSGNVNYVIETIYFILHSCRCFTSMMNSTMIHTIILFICDIFFSP